MSTPRKSLRTKLLILLFVTWWLAGAAAAQSTFGSFTGAVTDPSGSAVPGATVTVTDISTQDVRTTATAGDGIYLLTNLEAGSYQVEMSLNGFANATQEATLPARKTARVDGRLQLAGTTETVQVSATQTILETSSATIDDSRSPAAGAIVTEEILELRRLGRAAAYFGEPVTQLEHALQTAAEAEHAGATDALVVVALLHDIGHLVHGLLENVARLGNDAGHEAVGASWLAARFSHAVTEPIRLHVAAKRYLCAVELGYAESLSPASLEILTLQGGAMSRDEVRSFEQGAWTNDAVAVRRWDDRAKFPGVGVPGLDHYSTRITQLLT